MCVSRSTSGLGLPLFDARDLTRAGVYRAGRETCPIGVGREPMLPAKKGSWLGLNFPLVTFVNLVCPLIQSNGDCTATDNYRYGLSETKKKRQEHWSHT